MALTNLGGLATEARDFNSARDYLTKCIALDDTSNEAIVSLGIVEQLEGNLAEAKIQTGDTQGAIELLREDRSPQRFGSRFRAQQVAPGSTSEAPTRQPEDETKAGPSE